jgi:hypothetical protein
MASVADGRAEFINWSNVGTALRSPQTAAKKSHLCCGSLLATFALLSYNEGLLIAGKEYGHGLDHTDPCRNLHRPGNQRLSAARILIPHCIKAGLRPCAA